MIFNVQEFDVVKSVNPAFHKATEKINIYKHHRQTIQVTSSVMVLH